MLKGIIFALSACLIWGLIFVVPQFMHGFSSIEIALGRYFTYSILSLLIFAKLKFKGGCYYSKDVWIKALYFSLLTTMVYYTCVVIALRYSHPAICPLILGMSPIAITFYGNWKHKECDFKNLIIPSIGIFIGLLLVNTPQFIATESSANYCLGLVCSFIPLCAWSWYVVANSEFLKKNTHISSTDWSTLIGVASFFWVTLSTSILYLFFNEHLQTDLYFTSDPLFINFLIGCGILGIICSWFGAFLWNRASLRLPVTLAGQLTIFETIFGLTFVYLASQSFPTLIECIGIIILLGAILYGIHISNKNSPELNYEH